MPRKEPEADRERKDVGVAKGIQIPIEAKDLGDFLKGLLGQPRSIQKSFSDPFLVDAAAALNIDRILDQRVTGQHEAHLTDFTARVFFADGRVQHLKTREALQSFRDISQSPSVGMEITWTYLVKFHDRPLPEKQEVGLSIFCDTARIDATSSQRTMAPSAVMALFEGGEPRINLLVEYTELTWGLDIMNYLDGEITKHIKRRGILTEAGRVIMIMVLLPITVFGILFSPFMWKAYEVSLFNDDIRAIIKRKITETADGAIQLNLKLDYLMQQHASAPWLSTRYVVFLASTFLILSAAWLFILGGQKAFCS